MPVGEREELAPPPPWLWRTAATPPFSPPVQHCGGVQLPEPCGRPAVRRSRRSLRRRSEIETQIKRPKFTNLSEPRGGGGVVVVVAVVLPLLLVVVVVPTVERHAVSFQGRTYGDCQTPQESDSRVSAQPRPCTCVQGPKKPTHNSHREPATASTRSLSLPVKQTARPRGRLPTAAPPMPPSTSPYHFR